MLQIRNVTDIKGVLPQWFINFLTKNLLCLQGETLATRDKSTSGGAVKNENTTNQHPLHLACRAKFSDCTQESAEEYHKPFIRKFGKRNIYSPFTDNIWGTDLSDMQIISKFDKGVCFLLCDIDIFGKNARVILLIDKKGITTANAFQKILNESNHKPNKIWVDEGGEFYNRSIKSWLQDNDIEIYSTHNEGKSFVAERFIRILKYKIYKFMTSISKNVH